MDDPRDFLNYAKVMRKNNVPTDVLDRVYRDAKLLHVIAVEACNRELSRVEEDLGEALVSQISRTLSGYGIQTAFQHDPRGAIVKVRLPSGDANWFGGEGWYVVY